MDIDGFFSYAHNDNIHACLSTLKTDLCNEYRLVTGSRLDLYIDEERLSWGDKWKESIQSGIDGSSFFIPVLSPNYFRSGNCIKELEQYLSKAKRFEAKELLLPLYFSDVQDEALGLDLDNELINEVLEYQYCDMRRIRFCERGSAEYNKLLNDAVRDLARANQRLFLRSKEEIGEQYSTELKKSAEPKRDSARDSTASGTTEIVLAESSDKSEGRQRFLLDDNLEFKEVVDKLSEDLADISECIESIGEITNRHSEFMSAEKNLRPDSALALVARYAAELQPEADEFYQMAVRYFAHTNEADLLIPSVADALKMARTPSDKMDSDFECLIENAKVARVQMMSFRSALGDAKRLSRVLYKPLSSIEKSTTICLTAIETTIDWKDSFVSEWSSNRQALG